MKPWNFTFPLKFNNIEKTEDLIVSFGQDLINHEIKLEGFQEKLK